MFVDDDDFYNDDDDYDNENSNKSRNSKNEDYDDYDSYSFSNANSQMLGSVIGVAKEFIDDSTKELVNNKIKEVVSDISDSIDTHKLGKSLVFGAAIGVVVTIALYKILK